MERTTRAELAKDEERADFSLDATSQTRLDEFFRARFDVPAPSLATSFLKRAVTEEGPEEVRQLRLVSGSKPADISCTRGQLGPSMYVPVAP